jgi:hypothetical protein
VETAQDDTLEGMRRFALISSLFVATWLAAGAQAAGDGSLVVKTGAAPFTPGAVIAPDDVPVVSLRITGSVIGRVGDAGRIIIDAGPNCDNKDPQVVGAGRPLPVKQSDTAQKWIGADFTFRAVGCTFTVIVWGSHVSLVAAGHGTARLAGMPDTPSGDGKYSLNDGDFKSLPGTQTAKLPVGDGS